MSVTRCVCHRRTFADLHLLAKRHGWTSLRELVQHTDAGSGCGGCRPYLQAMLDTGCTRFAVKAEGQTPQPGPADPWER